MTFTNQLTLIEAMRHLAPNIGELNIASDKMATYCGQAIRRISEDKPRELTTSFVGTAAAFYKLSTTLASWTDGFSTIKSIVPDAPVLVDNEEVSYNTPEDYQLYDDGTGEYIRFTAAPDGHTVVVHYTVPYTVNGLDAAVATSVPSRWMNAVEFLATSILCGALATQSAGTTDSEIAGDLINYRTKQREYRSMAEYWDSRYLQAVGLGKDAAAQVGAALAHRAYPITEGRRFPRLTH